MGQVVARRGGDVALEEGRQMEVDGKQRWALQSKLYFDPTKELVPTFESAPLVEFASGRAALLRLALKAIESQKVREVFAKN